MAHASVCLITVAPSHCQIALGQIGSSSNLVGTSAFSLNGRQYIVGSLEVGHNLLHQLFVSELIVTSLLLRVNSIDLLIDPGHLIPELYELEIEVGTEETDLTLTDGSCLRIQFVASIGQCYQSTVATAY